MVRRGCIVIVVIVSCLTCITSRVVGVHGEEQRIERSAPSAPPVSPTNPYLFSVDVALSEGDPSVLLGIREGQSVTQAAAVFCQEQGFDEAMTSRLMPQIVQVLEEGIAEAMGKRSSARHSAEEMENSPVAGALQQEDTFSRFSTSYESLFTLDVSLDGADKKKLVYHAWQDPMEAAYVFCSEHMPPSDPEAIGRCNEALSSAILAKREAVTATPATAEDGARYSAQQHQELANFGSEKRPALTVPLNINGLEGNMAMFEGVTPRSTAENFCRKEEFALEGESLDSCVSQVSTVALHAISAHNDRQQRAAVNGPQETETEPFTFSVPVRLAGLMLFADFSSNERPRISAKRFCKSQLPTLENALGPELVFDKNQTAGEAREAGVEVGGATSRRDLEEACAQVVESAINAVLLGLRDLVMEAEISHANATQNHDDIGGLEMRRQEEKEMLANENVAHVPPVSSPRRELRLSSAFTEDKS